MKILIPRISKATTQDDLRRFAERVLNAWVRWPFSARPAIVACRILSITDSRGVTLRHGLLDVTPDDAARRIVRKLNGADLCGKRVGVKRFDRSISHTLTGA